MSGSTSPKARSLSARWLSIATGSGARHAPDRVEGSAHPPILARRMSGFPIRLQDGRDMMFRKVLLASAALMVGAHVASAKELKSIGISLGSMGNPFFVALAKGAEFEAKKTNPNVRVTAVGFDYDLGKQNTQIDNFTAAGVDMTLLNPGDPKAIEPAIRRAQAAGIIVVAVDTAAKGANATVETNNTQAGTIACAYLIEKMGGKGNMIILNGPQVSSVIERVNGCKEVIGKNSGVKLLSS